MNRYCIIMAGGVGTRFWPLSRQNKPKQFLDIMGTGKSFLRHTFERFAPLVPDENFIVVTNRRYKELIENLSSYLCEITGFKGCTLQPNSGAAGEYTGLRVIRAYLESIGQGHRNIVLLPASAHGTNPASAIQCGFTTVTVKCDDKGNIDLEDFRAKAEANKDNLAASMITYPSTHGIFEVDIKEMCDIVHACGGHPARLLPARLPPARCPAR